MRAMDEELIKAECGATFTVEEPSMGAISFFVGDNTEEPILTFHPDGRVTASGRLTPDEIAKEVLRIMTSLWPQYLRVPGG